MAIVLLWVCTSSPCCCASLCFVHVVCAGFGGGGGVKVRVCMCGWVLFGGRSRWLNGGKPANTVTLIGWGGQGRKKGEMN